MHSSVRYVKEVFVLAIAGLVVPLVGVVGLVLSILGYRRAKREGLRRGLSLAGVVVGAAGTILTGWLVLSFTLGLPGFGPS
jgi:hypothetical protein